VLALLFFRIDEMFTLSLDLLISGTGSPSVSILSNSEEFGSMSSSISIEGP
jgi:hypothetical protein